MDYFKHLFNRPWLIKAYYATLGTIYFLFAMIIYPFTWQRFKTFTTIEDEGVMIIHGASFFKYFWQEVSGQRMRWYDEWCKINHTDVAYYKNKKYLYIPCPEYPFSLDGDAEIFYNGIWNKVNQQDITWQE